MTHELIWAPWRLAYLQGEDEPEPDESSRRFLPGSEPDCFLCQYVAETVDRPRWVVKRREHCITVMNRYPYNNGHLLVAPKRHLARLDELDAPTQLESVQTITRMTGLLEQVLGAHGFNVGLNLGAAAGAGLPGHLHWHIVPRWNGDTNFMPSTAGVKVVPQSLDALWQRLLDELAHE